MFTVKKGITAVAIAASVLCIGIQDASAGQRELAGMVDSIGAAFKSLDSVVAKFKAVSDDLVKEQANYKMLDELYARTGDLRVGELLSESAKRIETLAAVRNAVEQVIVKTQTVIKEDLARAEALAAIEIRRITSALAVETVNYERLVAMYKESPSQRLADLIGASLKRIDVLKGELSATQKAADWIGARIRETLGWGSRVGS